MEENNENKYLFQVNLKGMIELLSEHIYSAPNVFVRELLQNGIDANTARKSIEENHKGIINVYLNKVNDTPQLIFEDNGIGLTEEEVHQFLSVIGQSSKRGDFNEKDFIGKFGIGMLSCLVVSHEIVVETRSLLKDKSVCWRGKADGTYTVETIDNIEKAGTRVILSPKKEWLPLFEKEELKKNILQFGNALPITINFITDEGTEVLVDKDPVWLNKDSSKEDLLEYGRKTFNINFLDAFYLHSEKGGIDGVAYIMPYKVQFSGSKQHKIYLKRMYLCEQASNLLPEWTSFVKCIINTNDLRPTASRESLMDDDVMKEAKKELSNCFKDYLKVLMLNDVKKLSEIISIHHIFIKALAVEDRELLKMFIDYIPFETNKGHMTFLSIKTYNDIVYYTPSLDDFRQIRRIAGSQGKTVINAAYSFEVDLIQKIKISFPDIRLEKITPQDILDTLSDVVISDDERYQQFEKRANDLLKNQYCKAQLKQFDPIDTPAIYVANDEAMSNKNIQNLSNSGNPFAATLHNFIKKEDNMPTLCFNKDNEIVQNLIAIEDETLFNSVVHIMYVQALMLGGYPVNKKEMTVFNDALYQLLIMGMSNFIGKFDL
ncbi:MULTISPECIES: HSP90 family protein [unclassified Dysgonomonas]|uniref:HSP90 family protein n=1 Tax=unclassified Dysgonomonas TaxID=2630389 RepID=UPI000681FE57|nr:MULTISPECIES: HSP90 family protein [unclassified Dysgonomonas]MBD8347906.1 HSP90 family protein [Dysgonomonas sp. HGC4]MBF0577209.1 HSP90 family protein [Dysgonomonas sp. GY617]